MDKKINEFLSRAPEMRPCDMAEIKSKFTSYLFIRRGSGELFASCCGTHGKPDQNDDIWSKRHTPEKSRYETPSIGYYLCPYCGKLGVVKEIRYTGSRKNLHQERRFIRLRWWRGALWAVGGWASMDFRGTLTPEPRIDNGPVYRFGSRGVDYINCSYYFGYPSAINSEKYMFFKKCVGHPYTFISEFGLGYDLIAENEAGKSPIKYTDYQRGFKSVDPIQFIHFAHVFPRQTEMLMKCGLFECIKRYIEKGVKSCFLLNWSADNAKDFLRLGANERKEMMSLESLHKLDTLDLWTKMRKAGDRLSMVDADYFAGDMYVAGNILKISKKWGVSPLKAMRYFDNQKNYNNAFFGDWRDYIEQGTALGMKMYRSDVLMPPNLMSAHDSVAGKYRKLKKEIKARELDQKVKTYQTERYKHLRDKYEYSADGLCIVIPRSAEDILAEGETLHHCVAGYAERHLSGATTILFLRKTRSPNRSYITIEINDRTGMIKQIHGYRNDTYGRGVAPREKFDYFLTPWLAWIAAGSKRNNEGIPIMPKKKGNKTA